MSGRLLRPRTHSVADLEPRFAVMNRGDPHRRKVEEALPQNLKSHERLARVGGRQFPTCAAGRDPRGRPHDTLRETSMETLSLIHISEPTRLGMISYAVFCLKKK